MPLGAWAHAVALYDVYHPTSTAGDQPSAASLQTGADRRDGQPCLPPAQAGREPRHRRSGVALTPSEGRDETTALVRLSAIGLERPRWPTVQHCPSWLGLGPHHRVSGGTVVRRRTTPWAHRAAPALRLAAACCSHSQSARGAVVRRMQARLGAPNALPATAHTLARLLSTMRTYGTAYVRQGMDEYAQQSCDRLVPYMARQAKALGDALVKAPEGNPA